MKGGIRSAKNIVKLAVFGAICIGGVIAVGLLTRWFFFNVDVAPISG